MHFVIVVVLPVAGSLSSNGGGKGGVPVVVEMVGIVARWSGGDVAMWRAGRMSRSHASWKTRGGKDDA